ncbi:HNH endonuclease signature motif containing protein [Janibacter melonis]|uniref:HNH endonuclease signature motif containing protein n=1 Tax=Janibacter melonis TaxID=262209 RepID=UPI00191A75D5|nr:HNH endonuclease signature motif containing protein [Janibacter melonis]
MAPTPAPTTPVRGVWSVPAGSAAGGLVCAGPAPGVPIRQATAAGAGTAPGDPITWAERRGALDAAVRALHGLSSAIHHASGPELVEVMGVLDELTTLAAAGRYVVTAQAHERGEVAQSDAPSLPAWVRQHAPSTRQGGCGTIAQAVLDLSRPVNTLLRDAVEDGTLTLPVARTVITEISRIESRLVDGARDTVLTAMIQMGHLHGSPGVRSVRPELLARHGIPGELDTEQDRLRRARALSRPVVDDGLHEYRLVLDPEGAAALEAAIEALSAPAPTQDEDTGTREPDLRTSDQRRADALLDLVRTAVAGMDTRAGRGAKATLLLTMTYDDLRAQTGAAHTLGGLDTGTLLAPGTVRRLACDADIIPVVLGSRSQVLDQGTAIRLFTPAMTRQLWLRDSGCTYPGCTAPARWTDAHHLIHWADGGPTDITNAALLCARHHTIVHTRRLHGHLDTEPSDGGPPRVVWDLTPGSYDHALTILPRAG